MPMAIFFLQFKAEKIITITFYTFVYYFLFKYTQHAPLRHYQLLLLLIYKQSNSTQKRSYYIGNYFSSGFSHMGRSQKLCTNTVT